MTVVAVLVIIGALAAPEMRRMLVRNKVASIGNEFAAALQQARALAVNRNTCASLCVASSSNALTCTAAAGADFQSNGWIIFQNPSCNAAAMTADAASGTVVQRTGDVGPYTLKASNASLNVVLFDPRGYANLAAAGNFQVLPTGMDDSYKRLVCLDAAGRATVRLYSSNCL